MDSFIKQRCFGTFNFFSGKRRLHWFLKRFNFLKHLSQPSSGVMVVFPFETLIIYGQFDEKFAVLNTVKHSNLSD